MRRLVARVGLGGALTCAGVMAEVLPAQHTAAARVGASGVGASGVGVSGVGVSGVSVSGVGAPGVGVFGVGGRLTEGDRRRWAPVASLLMPGSGQVLLRQDRFMAYLAVEAWAMVEFANLRTEARRQQSRYRGLARDVARSLYGARPPVGTWPYYEAMEKYVESGVFDRLPGGEVDPELDVETHNGAMWLLARQNFWSDPDVPPLPTTAKFRNAMNFYLDRAIRAEYRWSWRNAQLEQDLYVRTIRRYNSSLSEARQALGVVIANHLLSGVDAFVTLRVEGLDGGSTRGFAVRGSLPLP